MSPILSELESIPTRNERLLNGYAFAPQMERNLIVNHMSNKYNKWILHENPLDNTNASGMMEHVSAKL